MCEVALTAKAFSKMLLHAAKYPHCSINGIFLANQSQSRDDKCVTMVDAIPLFHLTLTLSPMMEIALQQIDAYCKRNGLVIAGYYQANEHTQDCKPNLVSYRIMDRIQEHCSQAYLFMIDNRSLSIECDEECYTVYTQEKDGKWKKNIASELEESAPAITSSLLHSKVHQKIVDFDNHLDDIKKSWTNSYIDEHLARAT